jgi:hypothetical protein
VSTKVRDPGKGYYEMATCDIKELIGKSKQEIYNLIDMRMCGGTGSDVESSKEVKNNRW